MRLNLQLRRPLKTEKPRPRWEATLYWCCNKVVNIFVWYCQLFLVPLFAILMLCAPYRLYQISCGTVFAPAPELVEVFKFLNVWFYELLQDFLYFDKIWFLCVWFFWCVFLFMCCGIFWHCPGVLLNFINVFIYKLKSEAVLKFVTWADIGWSCVQVAEYGFLAFLALLIMIYLDQRARARNARKK